MIEFWSLKRKMGNSIPYFMKRFNKFYQIIPIDISPSQATTKISFVGAFEPDFAIVLRERRSPTLVNM